MTTGSANLRMTVTVLLALCLGLYACAAGQGETAEKSQESVHLTVIFSGELEGFISPCDCKEGRLGGLARRAAFLKEERAKDPGLLLFDTGDAFVNYRLPKELQKNAVILEIFQSMGYDALTSGESEFQMGTGKLRNTAEHLGLPFLAANIFLDPDLSKPLFDTPYLIKESGGLRIGMTGIFNPDLNKTRLGKRVANLYFRDPVDACRDIVKTLKSEGCRFIIILAHTGQAVARNIAEEVHDIDLLIVGHGRIILLKPQKVNESYLVQVEDRGRKMGKLQIAINEEGLITSIHQDLIKLDETYEEDKDIKARIDSFYASLKESSAAPPYQKHQEHP